MCVIYSLMYLLEDTGLSIEIENIIFREWNMQINYLGRPVSAVNLFGQAPPETENMISRRRVMAEITFFSVQHERKWLFNIKQENAQR